MMAGWAWARSVVTGARGQPHHEGGQEAENVDQSERWI